MGAGRLLGGATLAPMAKSFDFHNTPGHLVRRAHQRTVALFMEETAGFDVTPVQFAILHELLARPGEDQVTLPGEFDLRRRLWFAHGWIVS